MRILFTIIFSFALGQAHAKDVEIRPADAAKHGITIKLSTLNPGIIQAVLQFASKPKEVSLVLQDSKDNFIASAVLLPRGQTYIAILSEEYLQHSYFAYPYTADRDEPRSYQVFLRDQP